MIKPTPLRKHQSRSASQSPASSAVPLTVLAPARKRQIARDLGKITSYLAAGGAASGMQELIEEVDFPGFVARLIKDVFNAAVDASIEQMDAYGQLLKDVGRAVDQFAKDDASAEQARDWLIAKYPELVDDADDDDDENKPRARARRKRFTHKRRRHLVAMATLMGINRIVVEPGRVRAKRTAGRPV
jgi:hypothetical protein